MKREMQAWRQIQAPIGNSYLAERLVNVLVQKDFNKVRN